MCNFPQRLPVTVSEGGSHLTTRSIQLTAVGRNAYSWQAESMPPMAFVHALVSCSIAGPFHYLPKRAILLHY